MNKTTILIVDDQPIVCEGLNAILQLEEDFEIIGVCQNGQDALDFCKQTQPDIILMDARMPVMNGILATKEISKLHPDVKVLILSTFNEEKLILDGLQNGAKGFLLKDTQPNELCKIIRVVQNGGVCLHPDVTHTILERIAACRTDHAIENFPDHHLVQLTNREKEVLKLIGNGLSNKEISEVLFITEGTVKSHVSSLLAKYGARDRTQLALLSQKI